MIARLWWKDARQFGPAWGAIALMAIVGFFLAGRYMPSDDGRDITIWGFALLFSGLYALAIATAAIAGERENRTLRLLDTLPAPRGRVWDGKVSFAVVSSMVLTLVLLGLAATQVGADGMDRIGGSVAVLGALALSLALILEAIGWGLFFSAIFNQVLAAAVLAACCLLLMLPIMAPLIGETTPTILMERFAPARLLIAMVTMGLSRVIFLASGPPHRDWSFGMIRSNSPQSLESSVGPATDASFADARPRASWPRALASLAWQASREARSAWPYLALLGLGVPAAFRIAERAVMTPEAPRLAMILNPVVALLAGVGVFHAEQRGRSFRFLTHQGVRPAFLWPIKVAAWLIGLSLIWLPYLLLVMSGFVRPGDIFGTTPGVVVYGTLLGAFFAVGLIFGMAIRRGITAALLAFLALVVLLIPVGMAIGIGLLHPLWTIVLPPALLAVSWAWTGPWMLDRPGASRWFRLAGLLALFFGPFIPLYVGMRAWSVPDRGPLPPDLRAQLSLPAMAEEEDAAPLYREAHRLIIAAELEERRASDAIGMGMSAEMEGQFFSADAPVSDDERPTDDTKTGLQILRDWLDTRAEAIELLRRASTPPVVQFGSLEGRTLFTRETEPDYRVQLADILGGAIDRRRQIDDLDGAWDDVLTLLRMGRQRFEPMTTGHAMLALSIEQQALHRAMAWAMDEGQTPERLRKALDAIQALPGPVDPRLVIATEQVIAEQTLDLPRDQFRDEILSYRTDPRAGGTSPPHAAAWATVVSTPWEIERARRVLRSLFHDWRSVLGRRMDRYSLLEPFRQRQDVELIASAPVAQFVYSPIESLVRFYDANEADRRALVQLLALRAWQLSHEGRLPDRLDELVPSELDRLPDDPYQPGRAFRYRRSEGLELPYVNWVQYRVPSAINATRDQSSFMLLYSVGPDQVDDHATRILLRNQWLGEGDIVYPVLESFQGDDDEADSPPPSDPDPPDILPEDQGSLSPPG